MALVICVGVKLNYKNIIYLISFCEVRLHFSHLSVLYEQFTLFTRADDWESFFLRFKTGIYTLSIMKTALTVSSTHLQYLKTFAFSDMKPA